MKIWFKDQYRKIRIRSRGLIRLVGRVLAEMGEDKAEVGLILTGDEEIRCLNRNYRGIDRATDVLAFAMQDEPLILQPSPDRAEPYPHLLGDVVISMEAAKRQARERGHSVEQEMAALIIHGLLHLLGYNHERSLTRARTMKRREKELLKLVSDSS